MLTLPELVSYDVSFQVAFVVRGDDALVDPGSVTPSMGNPDAAILRVASYK